jgi:hypothetical protein
MGCRVHHTPSPPDHIIYHLPVCVCLSVAQISLSMVFISTVIQTGFVYRWGGVHVVQLCHAC